MSRYASLQTPLPPVSQTRDSLELASLASSTPDVRSSISSTSSRSGISSSRKLSLEQDDPLDSANAATAASSARRSGGRPNPHTRAFSVSSAFDFGASMFPLSSSSATATALSGNGYAPIGAPGSGGGGGSGGGIGGGGGSLEKHKTLTYLNGLSLIVGLIIGSGIFSSPSQVNARVGSPGAALIVWAVAGVLAWTGAASYAELGGAIPLNGGAQVYLSKIFGEVWGFLFTWSAVLVLKPGGAAIISIIFGEYLVRAAVGAEAEDVAAWINKSVAVGGLLVVTLLNCVSTKLGTKMGDMFMFFKFVALLGVTVTGVVVAITGFSVSGEANNEWKEKGWFEGTSTSSSAWAVALYSGLWAFDGWDNTNYVVGEFRRPGRDLPRVIHTAMPLVILSYILANVAYFLVLPTSSINSSNTVAILFGHKVFGPIGSFVLALIVSASCFGALNASTFTGGRLVYVAGKEGFFPAMFGKIGIGLGDEQSVSNLRTRSWLSKRLASAFGDDDTGLFFTPINAMLFNMLLTMVYIVVGEFSTLLTFYGVAGYSFYFLTVLGLIVLRVKEPNLERPYKTWISTPIIFCCVSLFLLSRVVFAEPIQTLVVLGFVVAGVPVYFWRIKGRDGTGSGRPSKMSQSGESNRGGWLFWKR